MIGSKKANNGSAWHPLGNVNRVFEGVVTAATAFLEAIHMAWLIGLIAAGA